MTFSEWAGSGKALSITKKESSMQIEIRFSNEEMKFLKRFFYKNKRFKRWYLQHWRSVFGNHWIDKFGRKHKGKPTPDIFIWFPKPKLPPDNYTAGEFEAEFGYNPQYEDVL